MIPLVIALVGWAHAQEEPEIDGEWRVIASQLSDFPVDDDGNRNGEQRWLDHRLRTSVSGRVLPVLEGATEFDLAVGTLFGPEWPYTYTPDERRRYPASAVGPFGLKARRLSATTVVGNTQIEAGLVTSKWGLGLVANDGAEEPLFGRSDFGDRTLRVRATHMPGGEGPAARTTVLTTGAVDLVVEDEIASLYTGERAFQGIVSVLGIGRRGARAGAYFVARQQWEREDGRTTQAFVLDAFGDAWHEVGPDVKIRTAGEVAGIMGRTNRVTTYEARDRIGLASLGAVGELTASFQDEALQLHFHTGYASGDGSPDDGLSYDFSFDRDYGVGMVLFDEVMASIESATWVQVNDPTVAGVPPDGAELLVTEGSFRRAAFFQPAIQLRPTSWLDLRAGFAASYSTAFFAQPFTSARNGGVPTNHLGEPVETRMLGSELDWSVGVMRPDGIKDASGNRARYGFTVQGGHLGVGQALAGPGMPSTVHLVTGTARLKW